MSKVQLCLVTEEVRKRSKRLAIYVSYLDNITFFLTNIHNHLHFLQFHTSLFNFCLFLCFLSFTFYPLKTVVVNFLNRFSQRYLLNFYHVLSWLWPFNIFKNTCTIDF